MPLQAVIDLYDVDLNAEGDQELLDIRSSVEIDIRLSLLAYFTVIRNECIEHSAELLKTAADVFKLALRGLNIPEEQQELLTSVDQLCGATWSSEAKV